VSICKKAAVPNSFFGLSSLLEKSVLQGTTRTCDFVFLISDTYSMGHCFIEAIRSVTHLVLAPEPKKLFWFFFFSFLYIKSFFVFVFSYFSSA